MAQPYIGEIRMFAGNFAPAGWALCNGQLLPISQNDTLFQLLGTTYGGDGQETFALPDMQGRIPIHKSDDFRLAETGGVEYVTLTVNQIPSHSHAVHASTSAANTPGPANAILGYSSQVNTFFGDAPLGGNMNIQTIQPVGGSQPHSNLQPYLCVNFIIALFGVFPQPA